MPRASRLASGLRLAAALLALLLLTAPAPREQTSPVPGDWWTEVQTALSAAEYLPEAMDGGFGAPNRAQGLRLRFDAEGVSVSPRRASAGDWRWAWRTARWGRPAALAEAGAVGPIADARQIHYVREGLVEWYANGESGLEQGFTVSEAPPGAGPLCIVGAVETSLGFDPSADGDALQFADADGHARLRYDALRAWDDTGRELPCRMALADGALRLEVDDTGARYPVTLDPLLSTPDWLVQGAIMNAELGYRVAPAGDVNGDGYGDIIVGSPDYTSNGWLFYGRAWVFLGGAGGPSSTPHWEVTTTQDGCKFGYSVAAAGDVNGDGYDDVLVGAPDYAVDYYANGAAFLYLGSASGLDTSYDWREDGNDVYVSFGWSVAGAGDVNGDGYDDILIGDPYYGTTGRATLYLGGSAGPDHTIDWAVGIAGRSGNSVAGAGDVNGDGYADIAVGIPWRTGTLGAEGGFRVYHGGASGPDTTPDCDVLGDEIGEYLGYSVAGAGDVNGDGYADLLVGGVALDGYYATHSRVQLYLGGASGTATAPAWEITQADHGQALGYDIASAGDVNGDGVADVLVGCRGDDSAGSDAGRAWLYLGSLQGLATEAVWSAYGEAAGDLFGAVAGLGDVDGDGFGDVLVGAPGMSDDHPDGGALYCYCGFADMPKLSSGWFAQSDQAGAQLAYRVVSAGDVTGDGFDDLWVAAPWYDNGEADEGAVFLFPGGHAGLSYLPIWWAESNQENAHLGFGIDCAGDVNGDGLVDVIVGAPWYDTGSGYNGAAFMWYSQLGGIPLGTPDNADWSVLGMQASAQLGAGVCGIGDVNGDGYADVAVGAPYYDNGSTDEGGVWAYYGGPGGPSAVSDWFHDTDKASTGYGLRVSSAGDMNGDGYSDLLVGAPLYDHPETDEGLLAVYLGGEDGLQVGAPWWWTESDEAGAQLGLAIDCAGDVNADGYSDIIAGAPYFNGILTDDGVAYIWLGAATTPTTTPEFSVTAGQAYAHTGTAVAGVGDVDGDGYDDVLVGARDYDAGSLGDAGLAFLYRGESGGIDHGAAPWLLEGNQDGGGAGNAVGGGDFNGDGFADLVVGASRYTLGQDTEGMAFLFYGNGGRGLSRTPRQWQVDGATRLAPLGRSTELDAVAISARGRTPAGRGRVRLAVEVKPLGTPFDGAGVVTGPWTWTGAPGTYGSTVDLAPRVVGGLADDTPQHWRLRLETEDPRFPRTPWFGLPSSGVSRTAFRTRSSGTSVETVPGLGALALSNHPNPFNPATTLRYALPAQARVRLSVHDTAGRWLRDLVDETQEAGPHTVRWNGCDGAGRPLPSGVYFARLEAGAWSESRKLVLLK